MNEVRVLAVVVMVSSECFTPSEKALGMPFLAQHVPRFDILFI